MVLYIYIILEIIMKNILLVPCKVPLHERGEGHSYSLTPSYQVDSWGLWVSQSEAQILKERNNQNKEKRQFIFGFYLTEQLCVTCSAECRDRIWVDWASEDLPNLKTDREALYEVEGSEAAHGGGWATLAVENRHH